MKIAIQRGRLLQATALALGACAIGSPASAQIISPCLILGSPLPPPCITTDIKKLKDIATQVQQQIQQVREIQNTVQQTKASVQSIGEDIEGLASMKDVKLKIGGNPLATAMSAVNFNGTASKFAQSMFAPVKSGLDKDAAKEQQRFAETVRSNVDAYATSMMSSKMIEDSSKRMICLGRALGNSGNLRMDWAINAQVKLEISRQEMQKNELLAMLLSNRAVQAAASIQPNVGQQAALGPAARGAAPAARGIGWDLQSQLSEVEGKIRSTLVGLTLAKAITDVAGDAKSVQQSYANSKLKMDQAYNAFVSQASVWNRGAASYIVSTAMNNLSAIDAQMAALRSQPVGQLGGAFQARGIDAAAMAAVDVDPRQFIGTWGDPLKTKTVDSLSSNLLKGQLDRYISGGTAEKQFTDLLRSYNDARLEEAWMRNDLDSAKDVFDQLNALSKEESAKSGYAMTPDAAKAELEKLIAQANTLGQQIQQTGEQIPIERATGTLNTIKALLGGQDVTGGAGADLDGGSYQPTPSPTAVPTDVPDPEIPVRPNPRDEAGPVRPQ